MATTAAVTVALSLTSAPAALASSWVVGSNANRHGLAQSLAITTPSGVTSSCPAPFTSKTVRLTWTANPQATFSVYQSVTSATTGFTLVASGVTGTTWTSGTLANATYWYQLAAVYGTTWTSGRSVATASRLIKSTSPVCS